MLPSKGDGRVWGQGQTLILLLLVLRMGEDNPSALSLSSGGRCRERERSSICDSVLSSRVEYEGFRRTVKGPERGERKEGRSRESPPGRGQWPLGLRRQGPLALLWGRGVDYWLKPHPSL